MPKLWLLPYAYVPKDCAIMDMDGDLLDESFATCLTSSKATWQVYLGLWADYKLAANMRIGAAFRQKKDEMKLEQDRATWTINFSLMTQVNDAAGTSKKIRRTVVAAERVTMATKTSDWR